jgi:hypothetical protein
MGKDSDAWRIRYRKYNHEREYYFAALRLGKAGWLNAEEALQFSIMAYVQRQRVLQSQRGDLAWLRPVELNPAPPIVPSNETIFLTFRHVTLRQGQGGRFSRADDNIQDSGAFYITHTSLHLLGQKRNWSYQLADIRKVDYDDEAWVVYLKHSETNEYFRGENHPDITDAQLVANIIQALRGKTGD